MTVPSYPSGAGEQPAPAGHAPKEVENAFRLWIANAVLGLIGVILTFALMGAIVDAALKNAGVSRSQLGAAGEAQVRAGMITGVIIGVILIALYVFFAFQMRAGKNWARITLTVLGAIGVIFILIGFGGFGILLNAGPLGVLSVILTIVQLLLVIGAIFFMWRPAANAYFSAPSYR